MAKPVPFAIPPMQYDCANHFGDIVVFVDRRGWVYKYLIDKTVYGGRTTASRRTDTTPQMTFLDRSANRFRMYGDLYASLIGSCLVIYAYDITDDRVLEQINTIPYTLIFDKREEIDLILVPQLGIKMFRNAEPDTPTSYQEVKTESVQQEDNTPEIQKLLTVRNFRLEADEEDNGTFVFEGVCVHQAEQITEYGSAHISLTTDQSLKSDRILRFSNLFGDVILHAETDKGTDCDIFVVEGPDDLVATFHKSEHFFVAIMRAFIRAAEACPGYRCILILPNVRESFVMEWTGGEYGFTVNNQFVGIPNVLEGAAEDQCAAIALTAFFGNPVIDALIKTE